MELISKEVAALPYGNDPAGLTACRCSLLETHGLPCRHSIFKHLTGDGPL